jgi:hypothetical protein
MAMNDRIVLGKLWVRFHVAEEVGLIAPHGDEEFSVGLPRKC